MKKTAEQIADEVIEKRAFVGGLIAGAKQIYKHVKGTTANKLKKPSAVVPKPLAAGGKLVK